MEITHAQGQSLGMQSWIERRREEYHRTSKALRVVGTIGWALVALNVISMVR